VDGLALADAFHGVQMVGLVGGSNGGCCGGNREWGANNTAPPSDFVDINWLRVNRSPLPNILDITMMSINFTHPIFQFQHIYISLVF
jgi:hypothetical protein